MNKQFATGLTTACLAVLSACSSMPNGPMAMDKPFSQDALPEAVKVPAGHQVALQTVGVGQITYECKAKADAPGSFAWVFVGPQADLMSRGGAKLGTYFGPPATWASDDGSKVTGAQLAVAPAGTGNIPSQLVKANPAMGTGAMTGVTFIQRVATQGGVAPASTCDSTALGRKETVKYQADYIFWKAA
ncbi:MAG: DUF3455 domain-containing protein [Rubrivivax sp.]|nr:MAG: DUF3455 domain-containing protein [Rubrivivax sp.]